MQVVENGEKMVTCDERRAAIFALDYYLTTHPIIEPDAALLTVLRPHGLKRQRDDANDARRDMQRALEALKQEESFMNYIILGIYAERREDHQFRVFVAWQSNLPGLPFLWRCTTGCVREIPNGNDVQHIAAIGADANREIALRVFSNLPADRLSE